MIFIPDLYIAPLGSRTFEESKMGLSDLLSGSNESNNDENMETCVTCGARIPKWKYEENGGQCDHCVIEDSGIGML